MKSTGIYRQVDKLGRIVIPKEIRRNMHIRDNDNLEIYIENNEIILKKYDILDNLINNFNCINEIIYELTLKNIIITDLNKVISCNNKIKDIYLGNNILNKYYDIINKRENLFNNDFINFNIIDVNENKKYYIFEPIIINGNLVGSIILFSEKYKIDDKDKYLLGFISKYLKNNIED